MVKSEHRKRIGILGGTFDPIHTGHLVLAQTARKNLNLSKVIFIPAQTPPHKKRLDIISADLRYKMVKLAISENKYFSVSKIEIKKGAVSYSVETLRELRKKNPTAEFFFLVGSDALGELASWRKIDEIFKLCNFIVAKRPHFKKHALPKQAILLDGVFLEISSSKIRNLIRRRKAVKHLLPKKVYNFITKNSLYR